MKAAGLLAIFLAVASTPALAVPIAPSRFVIDSAEPYVYLKFDHTGKRKAATAGEGSEGLWLRLVNNCNLPITVLTFDLGTGDPGIGVPYSVVPVSGFRGPSEKQLKTMPHGYATDVGSSAKIPPGGTLLFSVPLDRVTPRWYIQARFDLALPGPRDGYNPYSLVDFSWDDLPDRYRTQAIH
jgi:hypothetical protein